MNKRACTSLRCTAPRRRAKSPAAPSFVFCTRVTERRGNRSARFVTAAMDPEFPTEPAETAANQSTPKSDLRCGNGVGSDSIFFHSIGHISSTDRGEELFE